MVCLAADVTSFSVLNRKSIEGYYMGETRKLLSYDKPKSIYVACIVFGILILMISVGFIFYEISGPDKEGLDADFASLEEEYGVIGCAYEANDCFYITVKDEVWDSMNKDEKYRYMSELEWISVNCLWNRNFLDYPKKPWDCIFRTSAGIVASVPSGDQPFRVYR
jgi:hypothetical protein